MRDRQAPITATLVALLMLEGVGCLWAPWSGRWLIGLAYMVNGLWFAIALHTARRSWYRLASSWLVALSGLRAVLYFLDDQRIAPLGLNGVVAVLVVSTYMGGGGDRWVSH